MGDQSQHPGESVPAPSGGGLGGATDVAGMSSATGGCMDCAGASSARAGRTSRQSGGYGFRSSGGIKSPCACDSGYGWLKRGDHPCGCGPQGRDFAAMPSIAAKPTMPRNDNTGASLTSDDSRLALASASRRSRCDDGKCSCNPDKLCLQTWGAMGDFLQSARISTSAPFGVTAATWYGNDFYMDASVNNTVTGDGASSNDCAEPCTIEWWECHNESFRAGREHSPTFGTYYLFEATAFKWKEYLTSESLGRYRYQSYQEYSSYRDGQHRCGGAESFTLTDHPGMTAMRERGSQPKAALFIVRLRGSGDYKEDVVELACKQTIGWHDDPFPFTSSQTYGARLWCTPNCGVRKKVTLLQSPGRMAIDAAVGTFPPSLRYCE